jgi:two-component system, sensor histidine kinase
MEDRVLVWAPPRDGQLTCGFLADRGFACQTCGTWEELSLELKRGAGTLVIAGEFLTATSIERLESTLAAQPPWSDLPLLIVVGGDTPMEQRDAIGSLGNVSLLPRPVAPDTLRAAVGAAVRGRRRQYQMRDLLHQRDEAERRKDEFLAMLAHELRNPLAPLRTGLQLLRLEPPPERMRQTHAMMDRQIGNLARLVDDLLDVSRITRRKIALKLRLLDVRDAVQQAVDAARHSASQKALHVDVSLSATPLIVSGDPVRLEQMIGNLLGNAIKYTPARGHIRVTAHADAGSVVVRVRDTGVGISPDYLPHVFDLFTQSTRSLDRTQGGLGIGLTVVKLLAELHGGTAHISSAGPGRGTEASIRLPVATSTAAVASEAPAVAPPHSQPRRIVIIEDNVDSAEMLAQYLQIAGHDVLVAYDGHAGLQAAARHRPDVIICDIGLPGLDGYSVARHIRSDPTFERCLLIAITGYGDVADRERTRLAGFAHHLTKPADPLRVGRLIASHQPAPA